MKVMARLKIIIFPLNYSAEGGNDAGAVGCIIAVCIIVNTNARPKPG